MTSAGIFSQGHLKDESYASGGPFLGLRENKSLGQEVGGLKCIPFLSGYLLNSEAGEKKTDKKI